jgi:hypothetical protein
LFLLPTVNVAETPEHEQRLTERFNERPASSESLMPEPPHHFHVSQIQLISGVLYDAFRSLKPESCEFRLFPEFRVDFPQDHFAMGIISPDLHPTGDGYSQQQPERASW